MMERAADQSILCLRWEQNYDDPENEFTLIYHSSDLTVPIAEWPLLFASGTETQLFLYPDLVPTDFFVAQNTNTQTHQASEFSQ